MSAIKKFVVEFKETYMPHSVTRECYVSSREEVIKIYELNNDDIEWYKIKEVS